MKEIQLTGKHGVGVFALVDDDDYDFLIKFKWRTRSDGVRKHYAYTYVNGRNTFMHRMIMGVTDPRCFVDHIDTVTLNNQKHNLRVATGPENIRNQESHNGSTSKYKGVHFNKFGKWVASISHNRVVHYLGSYTDEILAAKAYNDACAKMHGKFARFNVIDGYTDTSDLVVKWKPSPRAVSSKYRGVHWCRFRQGWVTNLYFPETQQTRSVGRFDNEEYAAVCYNKAAVFFFGDNARLNFVNHLDPKYDGIVFKKPAPNKPNSSKFNGVSYVRAKKKWIASIKVDGRQKTLGGFKDELDAARCYNKYAVQYYGDSAKLNDVD